MSRSIRLLCAAAVLAMMCDLMRAEDAACRFVERGYSYYQVEQQGELWTYVLSVSGPNWSNTSTRRSPGYLYCAGCSFSETKPGGDYVFTDRSSLDRATQRPPATAVERVERRRELWAPPFVQMGPENLQHLGSREAVNIGSLSGFAVLYRLVRKESGPITSGVEHLAALGRDVLVVYLTDGCVAFETTLIGGEIRDANIWGPLDSLLREVKIRKSPGAEPGPPLPAGAPNYVVRPRRKGEKPIYMPKDLERR